MAVGLLHLDGNYEQLETCVSRISSNWRHHDGVDALPRPSFFKHFE